MKKRRLVIVDNFAGGGGASTGIEWATGRPVDLAINHDPIALALHAANHPKTKHLVEDVFKVDIEAELNGAEIGIAWFSPDCRHFSKAKGGKPVSKKVRGLAWVVIKYIERVKPRYVFMENVEEFVTWGPLDKDNKPCPKRKGTTFRRWLARFRKNGYTVDYRMITAYKHGVPTLRKRLMLVARRDCKPIVWPEETHERANHPDVVAGKKQPWLPTHQIIEWNVPCRSMFNRKVPHAESTRRRVVHGLMKYVDGAENPFLVHVGEDGVMVPFITEHCNASHQRNFDINEPLRTLCANVKGGHFAVAGATMIQVGYGERKGQAPRVPGINKPLGTVVAGGAKHALVTYLTKHFTAKGKQVQAAPMDAPAPTITAVDHTSLTAAYCVSMYGTSNGYDITEPSRTITAGASKNALVAAMLKKYSDGAITDGIVHIKGEPYIVTDIQMRMFTPRECYRAQGFPDSYQISEVDLHGSKTRLTIEDQIRLAGNSVCPKLAELIVRANAPELCRRKKRDTSIRV